ncbi:MAG: PQQ-dependent sugar dehydrogenase [Deferrisomatales bacterium]|nr:PQQ-dependent sugar dehydrogenase [Deferrisomatales bacterium]
MTTWKTRAMGALLAGGVALGTGAARAGIDPLSYHDQELTVAGVARQVRVVNGYRLEVLTTGLDAPRLPIFGSGGELLIGSRSGRVYRLLPPYREPEVLLTLSGYPHSVAVREGELLIAATDGLYRAPYHPGQTRIDPGTVIRLAPLPGGRGHSSRSVARGPDGRVYLSLGIAGNCSDQYLGPGYSFDDQRGGILVLKEGGGKPGWEPFASGLRNPVGFSWHPVTGELYATNNGPDHLGFDQPPEYFSRVPPGSFHGMPWFQFDGARVHRDDCVASPPPRPLAHVLPPVATFPSRNAPLGMAFVPLEVMGPLAGDAVVALHGSWGTAPGGSYWGSAASRRPPKLVAVRFVEGKAVRTDDLVTGFQLPDGERWARPAGVAVGSDGSVYFTSDDATEGVFRLTTVTADPKKE